MSSKTIAFLGASNGIGHFALKEALAAGAQCTALCRTPSKLTNALSPSSYPNLTVVEGNAHDEAAVARCILASPGRLVDEIVFSIGAAWSTAKWGLDDANVCEKGIKAVVAAVDQTRREQGATGRPHIVVLSTTGMSRFGRDTPLVVGPLYSVLLKVPHKDKRAMEDTLIDSGEAYTIVRAAWLINDAASNKPIRVGLEDARTGREVTTTGYNISREDAGRWIAKNLVLNIESRYQDKIVSIAY